MSILISHIYQDDYSSKIKDNKFFYGYVFILGCFIGIQIYSLSYFYDNLFFINHKDKFELINNTFTITNTIINTKDLYLRNVKVKQYLLINHDDTKYAFDIIQKDIHSSLALNIFTFFTLIFIYNKYNSLFFKWILEDKMFITRSKFIKYIAFASYLINISYGIVINNLWHINKLQIKLDNMGTFVTCIYYYYYMKLISMIAFVSMAGGTLITILLYYYVFKNLKKMINKNN
jgi:hypothetical protein